jgi:hypothetical protein
MSHPFQTNPVHYQALPSTTSECARHERNTEGQVLFAVQFEPMKEAPAMEQWRLTLPAPIVASSDPPTYAAARVFVGANAVV